MSAEITKRMAKELQKDRLKLTTLKMLQTLYAGFKASYQRAGYPSYVDTKNKIIKDMVISTGTVNTSIMPI